MNEPTFDEHAAFLTSELETYREQVMQNKLRDRRYFEEQGETDFGNLDARTEEFRTMGDDELFDRMINNFWSRLPGGFYRDVIQKNIDLNLISPDDAENKMKLLDEVETLVKEHGYETVSERVVAHDDTLDGEEKRQMLKILYCEMRKRGYDWHTLTS